MSRVADLYAKRTSGGSDAEVLIAKATHEVEGLLRFFGLCETECVGLDLRLDGGAHVRRRTKKPVRRYESITEALVSALEVVVLDEELDPPKTVREVGKHRLAEKLVPQRLPEAFDLAERLRVLRPALGVPDPAALQELLKLRLSAPRDVLPALVGQHLLGFAVLGDAALECLDDQTRLVVVSHRPRHQVPRVVVHEADNVDDLMSAQLELKDVGLPQLVGLRAFEATRRFVTRTGLFLFCDQPGLVQDATHGRFRHPQALEAAKHVTDAACSPVRVLFASRHDLLDKRCLLAQSLRPGHRGPRQSQAQCVDTARLEQAHELLDHRG